MWKFHSNKLLSFENINIFIFLWSGSELPNHAPFLRVFVEFDQLNVVGHHVDLKRHNLAWFRVIWAIVYQNPPKDQFSTQVREKIKTKEEALYITYLARCFLTADLYQVWVTYSSHGRNQCAKFYRNRLRVWSLWRSNFGRSHKKCMSPLVPKLHLDRLVTSLHDTTRSTCRARRDERVEPCCSTSTTQPKCIGSTRRTCRVVSRRGVTSQVEFGLNTVIYCDYSRLILTSITVWMVVHTLC